MAKYESFEEKVIKKLKDIEIHLSSISDNVYYAADNMTGDGFDNAFSLLDSISDSMSSVADALADETYLNGTRQGSAFDSVKQKQDETIKILEDVQSNVEYMYDELNDINSNIVNLKYDLHDVLVQAIRDAMNPEYEIPSKETEETDE